jgi:hypothetical protein
MTLREKAEVQQKLQNYWGYLSLRWITVKVGASESKKHFHFDFLQKLLQIIANLQFCKN